MSEVRFGRLPGLSAHDRLQFLEQRFVGIGEMRKRPAQNGRHVLPGEPGAPGSMISMKCRVFYRMRRGPCPVVTLPVM